MTRGAWRCFAAALLLLACALGGLVVAADAERPATDIPVISVADLPAQARETIALIRKGGPFPYERDGIEFRNFEKRLPLKPRGHYREYTVRTPGVKHRGARRIVAGRDGELYYTDDHYGSFRRIIEK